MRPHCTHVQTYVRDTIELRKVSFTSVTACVGVVLVARSFFLGFLRCANVKCDACVCACVLYMEVSVETCTQAVCNSGSGGCGVVLNNKQQVCTSTFILKNVVTGYSRTMRLESNVTTSLLDEPSSTSTQHQISATDP